MSEAYCRAKGWDVLEVVEDLNVSGSDKGLRLDRPGLTRVRELLPAVDVVVFAKLDRLARNVIDFRAFAEEADAHDASLVSVAESLDLTTPGGRFVATILAAFAEMEAAAIAARSTEGQAGAVALGRWRGGMAPYGYKIVPHESGRGVGLAIEPDEAEIVREVVERLIGGETLYRITQDLNLREVPGRRGGKWNMTPLRRIVVGEAILGRMVRHGAPLTDDDGLPAALWPPLVSVADAYRVRALLPDGVPLGKGGRLKASRLLSGIAECSTCGAKMVVNSRPDGSKRYKCPTRSKGSDACVRGVSVKADALDDYIVGLFLAGAGNLPVRRVEIIAADTSELQTIEAAIAKTADDMRDPGADIAMLVERLTALRARREALQAAPVQTETRLVDTGRTFAQEWEATDDLHVRRDLLRSVLDTVVVGPSPQTTTTSVAERVMPLWRES